MVSISLTRLVHRPGKLGRGLQDEVKQSNQAWTDENMDCEGRMAERCSLETKLTGPFSCYRSFCPPERNQDGRRLQPMLSVLSAHSTSHFGYCGASPSSCSDTPSERMVFRSLSLNRSATGFSRSRKVAGSLSELSASLECGGLTPLSVSVSSDRTSAEPSANQSTKESSVKPEHSKDRSRTTLSTRCRHQSTNEGAAPTIGPQATGPSNSRGPSSSNGAKALRLRNAAATTSPSRTSRSILAGLQIRPSGMSSVRLPQTSGSAPRRRNWSAKRSARRASNSARRASNSARRASSSARSAPDGRGRPCSSTQRSQVLSKSS